MPPVVRTGDLEDTDSIEHAPGAMFDGKYYWMVKELPAPEGFIKVDPKTMRVVETTNFSPGGGVGAGFGFDGRHPLIALNNDLGGGTGSVRSLHVRSDESLSIYRHGQLGSPTHMRTPVSADSDGRLILVPDISDALVHKVLPRHGESIEYVGLPSDEGGPSTPESSLFDGKTFVVVERDSLYLSEIERRDLDRLVTNTDEYRRDNYGLVTGSASTRALADDGRTRLEVVDAWQKTLPRGGTPRDVDLYDDFEGPDETQLSSHTPAWSPSGTNWQTAGVYSVEWELETWSSGSSRANPVANTDADNPILIEGGFADAEMEVRVSYVEQLAGIYYRYIDASNYGLMWWDGTTLTLAEVVGGAFNSLSTSTSPEWTPGTDRVMRLQMQGRRLTGFLDARMFVQTLVASESLLDGTLHGMFTKLSDTARFDSFRLRSY